MGAARLRCSFCHWPVSEEFVAGAEAHARCPACGDRLVLEPRPNQSLLTTVRLIGGTAVVAAIVVGVMLGRTARPGKTPSEAGEASAVWGEDFLATASAGVPATEGVAAPTSTISTVVLAAPGAANATENAAQKAEEALDLSYRWKVGEYYCYRVSCKAGSGDSATELVGANTYTVGRAPDVAAKPDPRDARPGSGTAFVVSPDGYLLTCAHVVRNATDIKVTLGGETSPCEVVVRDDARDLAVLRMDRRNLPALPLADSEKVELAQEVRAIGFPLADILGSSLKVTQGSVAGITFGRRGKVFQIDAVVNPGNSGGPLVDSSGCVVGVVSAQLVGAKIAEVGFAVPINYAKSLLRERKIGFQAGDGGTKLDGPTLVKRVAPAVGLVTMMCRGDDSDGQKRIVLNYHAIVERREGNRDALAAAPSRPEERDDGKLVVGELGEVFESDGRVRLPGLLGSLATVVIDPLPDGDQKSWLHEEVWTLTSSPSGGRGGFPGFGPGFFGPRPPLGPHRRGFPGMFGPFAIEPEPVTYLAIRRASFTLEETQQTTARIRKRLDLRTLEKTGEKPTVELAADGETLFDLKLGVPRKITLSGKLTIREGGSQEIPVSLVCERTMETAAASAPASAGSATPSPSPPSKPVESPEKRLDRFLADLRARERDWSKCFQALQGLSLMPVVESRREEVAEVLNAYLKEKNYSARSSALRAALIWVSPRNAPVLAELVKSPTDRARAIRALRAIGSAAEGAVVALLAEDDAEVRVAACQLLAEIGGPQGLAAIQQRLPHDADEQFQAAAQAAIRALRAKK